MMKKRDSLNQQAQKGSNSKDRRRKNPEDRKTETVISASGKVYHRPKHGRMMRVPEAIVDVLTAIAKNSDRTEVAELTRAVVFYAEHFPRFQATDENGAPNGSQYSTSHLGINLDMH